MIIMKTIAREPSRLTRDDFLAAVLTPWMEMRMRTLTPSVVSYGRAFSDAAIQNTDAKMEEMSRLRTEARASGFSRELVAKADAATAQAEAADRIEEEALSWQNDADMEAS